MTHIPTLRSFRQLPGIAALCVLFACATTDKPAVDSRAEAPQPAPAPTASQASAFKTQTASFSPTAFNDLPGWREDNVTQSWNAFTQSCQALRGKNPTWEDVCKNAQSVNAASPQAIRLFFEKEFVPFQIQDINSRRRGVVTGYFESQLRGSRKYGAPYVYPVYASPADMLYLDARSVSAGAQKQTIPAAVNGNRVTLGAGDYSINLSQVTLDVLDKKVRLRAEGNQLLPYYTRSEIESLGAPNAKVIAFVDDAAALYEMQIQGSGRIQLNDGTTIRVSMAEQNGHPFRPTLASNKAGKPATKTTVRGGNVELDADDDDGDEEESVGIRTRGFQLAAEPAGVMSRATGAGNPAPRAAKTNDPSYVFFRENAGQKDETGPLGALGIPLTAERSIAVDPRNVPMGYPVFVSTRDPETKTPMRRLTIAQDTGGAIRGAVRADYFFGFGQKARAKAARMKENGEMWVLLPRGIQLAAASTNIGRVRVRGAAGGSDVPPAECLIPDDTVCVEGTR